MWSIQKIDKFLSSSLNISDQLGDENEYDVCEGKVDEGIAENRWSPKPFAIYRHNIPPKLIEPGFLAGFPKLGCIKQSLQHIQICQN